MSHLVQLQVALFASLALAQRSVRLRTSHEGWPRRAGVFLKVPSDWALSTFDVVYQMSLCVGLPSFFLFTRI